MKDSVALPKFPNQLLSNLSGVLLKKSLIDESSVYTRTESKYLKRMVAESAKGSRFSNFRLSLFPPFAPPENPRMRLFISWERPRVAASRKIVQIMQNMMLGLRKNFG